MKIEGSGSGSRSISQRHGSADPDPHQNVMDPEHCMGPESEGGQPRLLPEGCQGKRPRVLGSSLLGAEPQGDSLFFSSRLQNHNKVREGVSYSSFSIR